MTLKRNRLRTRGLGSGKPVRLKRMWHGIHPGIVIDPAPNTRKALIEDGIAEEISAEEAEKAMAAQSGEDDQVTEVKTASEPKRGPGRQKRVKDDTDADS